MFTASRVSYQLELANQIAESISQPTSSLNQPTVRQLITNGRVRMVPISAIRTGSGARCGSTSLSSLTSPMALKSVTHFVPPRRAWKWPERKSVASHLRCPYYLHFLQQPSLSLVPATGRRAVYLAACRGRPLPHSSLLAHGTPCAAAGPVFLWRRRRRRQQGGRGSSSSGVLLRVLES